MKNLDLNKQKVSNFSLKKSLEMVEMNKNFKYFFTVSFVSFWIPDTHVRKACLLNFKAI